ncbi:MAG: GHKL domain-containing protein [Hungatella sp.]|nr:GHKL domain-containing protein [Hungatella sp.]
MWGEAFVSLLESVFWVYFQTKYHGKRIKGLAGKAGAACALLLLALNIWIADYYTKYSSYTFLVDLFTLFWYSEWFLAGKRSRKVFSIFIFYIGLFSCNFICMAVFAVVFSVPVKALVAPGSLWRAAYVVTTKVLLFAAGILFLRKQKGIVDESGNSVLFLLIPGLTIGIASMVMNLFARHYDSGGGIGTMVALLLLAVGLMLVSLYLLRRMYLEKARALENRMLRRQMELQKKTYDQMQSYLMKSRKLHHDMKHKLVVAEQLLCQGHADEGEKYLRKYLEELEGISAIRVGDHAWETMVLMKKEAAKAKEIAFYGDIESGGWERVDEMDLCVLLGNLLDNALEAEECLEGHREVRMTMRREDGRLLIKAENYIAKSVLKENRELRTTKPDDQLHGLGIRCIREIVKKYDGKLRFYECGSWFAAEIKL